MSLVYKVSFKEDEKSDKKMTLTCHEVHPSEIFGLICLQGFIFKDNQIVIDPSENDARRKYENTERLHLPHHLILSVEEFYDHSISTDSEEEQPLTLTFEENSEDRPN